MHPSSRNGFAGKLTYSNVTATLALFIALGGVSWAATMLPKNSVGTKQIKKNAVTNSDIKKNAVTGVKVKSSTLTGADVKDESLTGSDVSESTLGEVPLASASSQQLVAVGKGLVTASDNNPAVARTAATEVPLLSHGQISLYGKCFREADTDTVYGEIYVRTSANGGMASLYNSSLMYGDVLNTTTIETDRITADTSVAAGGTNADFDYDASKAVGPDGDGAFFSSIVEVNNNDASASVLYPGAQSCIFTVQGVKIKS